MASPSDFDLIMHRCTSCKDQGLDVVKDYPVISFGDLRGKDILVVGINPSSAEYEGFLSRAPDPYVRYREQMEYFDKRAYDFFRKLGRFFEGRAKTGLGWERNPWEKVGFTDMVKCPTRNSKGQWAKLRTSEKREITENCRKYLTYQLNKISPSIIMTYGADVCRWFYPEYTQDDAYTLQKFMINGKPRSLILVPQVQGGNTPKRFIEVVQDMIADCFKFTT